MYEMLMELPIFKGAGKEHISKFVEKTPVEFKTFHHGEVIASPDEECKGLLLVLRGKVRICYDTVLNKNKVVGESLRVPLLKEVRGSGSAIGIDLLYGLSSKYNCTVYSEDKTDLLYITKAQLQSLLMQEPLYLVNAMNILSRNSQRGKQVVCRAYPGSLYDVIAKYVILLTEWNSSDILITSSLDTWSELMCKDSAEIKSEFEKLINEGILEVNDKDSYRVFDRLRLIEPFL